MPENIERVFDLIPYSIEKSANEHFLNGKVNGKWRSISKTKFKEQADLVSNSLINLGLGKASRVAIMSNNRLEWNICDFAIMQIGAYQIPLYPTLGENDVKFILEDAEITHVFVADKVLFEKISLVIGQIDKEITVYSFDEVSGATNWEVLLKPNKLNDLSAYQQAVDKDDILTIIYTSGTTGRPKGVMLTHNNLVQNVKHASVLFPDFIKKTVSFLPLSHIFERMIVYMYIYLDVELYYAESMDTIVADIQEVKPDGFSCVPRLLEKIYDRIMEKGKSLTGIKRSLFFWSVALAEEFDHDKGFWYKFKLGIARKLVFVKWKEALGGEIKLLVSGGAALNPRLCRIFWAAGIPVFEGYGLTETSPVITVNNFTSNKFGTVGAPIEGVEIKIAEDGEVLTRGHNVMKGYYKQEEITRETIDTEGWFHTGDIGEIIDGKYLKITDRKKEIFKTAGGKYIAPQPIENKFKESFLIEQIMVLGENRRFASALIVPSIEPLKKWCSEHDIQFSTLKDVLVNPAVIQKYNEELKFFNKEFGRWEQLKCFVLLDKEWSIDGGELTPKLSLKRKFILGKYESQIEEMYRIAESNFKENHNEKA